MDLGELNNYLDDYDITFTYNGTTHHLTPNAQQILALNVKLNRAATNDYSRDEVWAAIAPLYGDTFDPETCTFNGGILEQLIDDGITFGAIDKLLTATFLRYMFGTESAQNYLNKLEGKEPPQPTAQPPKTPATSTTRHTRKTQKTTGETDTTDSETPKD